MISYAWGGGTGDLRNIPRKVSCVPRHCYETELNLQGSVEHKQIIGFSKATGEVFEFPVVISDIK